MRKSLTGLSFAAVCCLLAAVFAQGQDFHKSYAISSNGHISIRNVSGDVKVAGYNGDSVVVDAFKVGRDRDLVKVEDSSTGDRIELRVQYPESGNCDAGVNFQVLVPSQVEYNFDRLASVSGNVEVMGIRGRLHVESVSGNVGVTNVAGIVSASSVSGNVEAQVSSPEGLGDMKFSSVSGNVDVRAPLNLNADIEMSSVSGSLHTDFPISIEEREYGPGHSARGRIGSGTNGLRVTTVSGRVSLTRI